MNSDAAAVWPWARYPYELSATLPEGLTEARAVAAIEDAFAAWSTPDCTAWTSELLDVATAGAKAGDGQNTIQFVFENWEGTGADPDAGAITDIVYEQALDGTWYISEADIYLNAEGYEWRATDAAGDIQLSLLAVVLHEAGHVLGLLHPCEVDGSDGAPRCDEQFDGVTMHPQYETTLSELSPDDEDGVCFLYPALEQITDPAEEVCTNCEETVVSGGPAGSDCDADADCDIGLLCVDGVCQEGQGLVGDPCVDHADCSTSRCSEDGYCSSSCTSDDDCSGNAECVETENGVRACELAAAPFAASCRSADECVGGVCIAEEGGPSVCSRECGPGLPDCPAGWTCGEVDGESVCVPPAEVIGCQCRAAGFPSRVPWGWGLVAVAIGAATRGRMRVSSERIKRKV